MQNEKKERKKKERKKEKKFLFSLCNLINCWLLLFTKKEEEEEEEGRYNLISLGKFFWLWLLLLQHVINFGFLLFFVWRVGSLTVWRREERGEKENGGGERKRVEEEG